MTAATCGTDCTSRATSTRWNRSGRRAPPGKIYDIGDGAGLPGKGPTALLPDAVDAGRDSVEFVADREGHDRRCAVDHGKITALPECRPRRDFRGLLAGTVAWCRDHRSW
ncbi:hypothetical protein [Streptomyces prasinopilosus]|uniref:hypothetical protein n=1 Tax=Streptomyces prasinopilosus TaxID=67344 RepID=UPI001111ED4B|nr:hypothetical protein [Streptomyces prasinopilosus]